MKLTKQLQDKIWIACHYLVAPDDIQLFKLEREGTLYCCHFKTLGGMRYTYTEHSWTALVERINNLAESKELRHAGSVKNGHG